MAFKVLDSDNNRSILGLFYEVEYNLSYQGLNSTKRWQNRSEIAFKATGTVTRDSDKNPRNFLDTNISLSKSISTRIPVQDKDFANNLTEIAVRAAQDCEDKESKSCKNSKNKAFEMLNSTSDYLRAFQRYEVGLNGGYESDQNFEITQAKFGGYVTGQYESWGTNSLIPALNLIPTFRLAVDKIDPDDATPRSLAGDDSSYFRYSVEASLWTPVGMYFDQQLALTFNYRRYGEIEPSKIVKDNNLDIYNLLTISLTNPTGLFISYSSGRLPLAQHSDNVLEVGWNTYF